MVKTLTIKVEVPDEIDIERLKEEINRTIGRLILIEELKDVDVDEKTIDEIAEEIKKSGWERMKKWLN